MSKTTSVLSFESSSTDSASFAIEQVDYPVVDPDNFATWLTTTGRNLSGSALFSAWYQYVSGCSEDGMLCATLRVRLSDIVMGYNLRLSYGDIVQERYLTESRQEFLTFELETSSSVDFGAITDAVWNGDVYNADSEIIDNPGVVLSGTTATTSTAVYGVLECTVVEELWEHDIEIAPRTPTEAQLEDDDIITADLYASTAMLFCDSRIKLHEVEMPDNLGTCSGGYGGSGMTVPDDEEDEEQTYNVLISDIFDYCTGASISEPTVYIDGSVVTGESVTLTSGTHTVRVTADGYTATDEDDLTENDSFTLP